MRRLDDLICDLLIAAIKVGREMRRLQAIDTDPTRLLEARGLKAWHLRWIEALVADADGLPL